MVACAPPLNAGETTKAAVTEASISRETAAAGYRALAALGDPSSGTTMLVYTTSAPVLATTFIVRLNRGQR